MLSNGSNYQPLTDWLAAPVQAEAAKTVILRRDNEYGRLEQLGTNMLQAVIQRTYIVTDGLWMCKKVSWVKWAYIW